jgi:nitronate monooxygenase
MQPTQIRAWVSEVRASSNGAFQLNLWIPDPAPLRDRKSEKTIRTFLSRFGPEPGPEAGDATPPDFEAQCEAILETRPLAVSSVMGLFPAAYVARLRAAGIAWFATVTTLAEAKAAEVAGADVLIAQGAEAGGHRGAFDAALAERQQVGLFALLPAIADSASVPVAAAGGIADARGIAAALILGASAVQIGTGFLRTPEACIHPAWAQALGDAAPEDAVLSRAFSGRTGRSLSTGYVRAALSPDAPAPAPYPVQRGLTAAMRAEAQRQGDVERMQAWAGQAAALARPEPASDLVTRLWEEARRLIS